VHSGHSLIERSRQQHGAQTRNELRGIELRRPRADGFTLMIEHPDQCKGEIVHVRGWRSDVWPSCRTCLWHYELTEIWAIARPGLRLRNV
jgi:hypothetical protein